MDSAQLFARLFADPVLMERFRKEPASVLSELGVAVPPGVEVRVLEDTPTLVHVVIPHVAETAELEVETEARRSSKIFF